MLSFHPATTGLPYHPSQSQLVTPQPVPDALFTLRQKTDYYLSVLEAVASRPAAETGGGAGGRRCLESEWHTVWFPLAVHRQMASVAGCWGKWCTDTPKDTTTVPCSTDVATVPCSTDVAAVPCNTDVATVSCSTDVAAVLCSTDVATVSCSIDVATVPSRADVVTVMCSIGIAAALLYR